MLDFINTAAWRRDGAVCAEYLPDYFKLVRWGETSELLSEGNARALRARSVRHRARALAIARAARALRAMLRTAIVARMGNGRIDTATRDGLNAWLRAALVRRRLADDLTAWTWRDPTTDLALPLRHLVLQGAELLTAPVIERVRVCPGAACGALFLDASRGAGRRWCDMAVCGNRAKARRHRVVRRPGVTPSGRGR